MAAILGSIALGLAVILSLVATKMLIRSDFESRFQKSAACSEVLSGTPSSGSKESVQCTCCTSVPYAL